MVLVYCAAMGSEPQQCILFSAKSVRGIRVFITQRFDDEWVFITQISGSMPQSRAEEWMCIALSCADDLTDLAKGVFEVGNVGC